MNRSRAGAFLDDGKQFEGQGIPKLLKNSTDLSL